MLRRSARRTTKIGCGARASCRGLPPSTPKAAIPATPRTAAQTNRPAAWLAKGPTNPPNDRRCRHIAASRMRPELPIESVRRSWEDRAAEASYATLFQDKDHGMTTDRPTMIFFCASGARPGDNPSVGCSLSRWWAALGPRVAANGQFSRSIAARRPATIIVVASTLVLCHSLN